MTFTFTPATPEDWDVAWAIQREAFLDLVTRTWGGWTEEQVRRCAEAWAPASTRLVGVGGEIVGWVRAERRPDHDWLDLIVLDPRFHGRGLGTSVMRALIGEAEARGAPLRLSCYKTNPARRLYARLGFGESERDELRVFMVWPGCEAAGVPPG